MGPAPMQPAAPSRVVSRGKGRSELAMRHSMTLTTTFTAAVLLSAAFGLAAAQGQTPAPSAQQSQPDQQNREQPLPQDQNPLPRSPQHQRQTDDALQSESGRAGKREPLPQATTEGPVFMNGALNVPGAPKDSQTVPAKFSERNAALDKLPTMAAPLRLSDEQRKKILATIRAGNAPVANVNTSVAEQLPSEVEIRDIPDAVVRDFPEVNSLKYARGGDRVLLVDPPNRIVVAEIKE